MSGFIFIFMCYIEEMRKMLLVIGMFVVEIMDIFSEFFDINYGVNNELVV